MEKPKTTPEIRYVEKPKSSWTSLFNGAGNGAMIGSIPFAIEFLVKAFNPAVQINPTMNKVFAMTTLVGAGIGAVYGMNEAKQLNEYRAALAADIENLHAKVDGLNAKTAISV